jgi:hypothetical protein
MPRFIESEEFEEKIQEWEKLGLKVYFLPAILGLENRAFSLCYENAKKFSQITKATDF